MQGRFSYPQNSLIQSFPKDSWMNEFKDASECGFDVIEWVFDDLLNPIFNNKHQKISFLSKEYGIKINSLCADYFMTHKIFNESTFEIQNNLELLSNLIDECYPLGIKILEIPLVDSSSLKKESDKQEIIRNLQQFLEKLEKYSMVINLETDLPPKQFKELLEKIDSPFIRANYDTGNSASLGYNSREELEILSSHISNIHIKDRLFKGETVLLGKGSVNFDLFFTTLSKINYSGDLIIQGAREIEFEINPYDTCKKYYNFVKDYIDRFF